MTQNQDDKDKVFGIVKSGYDKIAESYTTEREKIDNWKEVEEFCSKLTPKAKVLDIGCGTGIPIASHLVESGYEVTGIDLSSAMISVARKNVPEATFLQMNMTEIDFPPKLFDALISCYAVFHVPREQHGDIFRSFNSILKAGGSMLVSVGNSEWEEIADYYDVDMFWSHYRPAKTEGLITRAGFEIEFGRTVDCGGEKHYWVLARKR